MLETDSVRDQVLWATAFLFSLLVVMFMKVWYWMEMNKNASLAANLADNLAARPPS